MRVVLLVASCLCFDLPSKFIASGFVVSEGEPWTLNCSSEFNSLVWFKDNQPIDDQRIIETAYPLDDTKTIFVSQLKIPLVNFTDAGLYQCFENSSKVVALEYLFVKTTNKLLIPLPQSSQRSVVKVSTGQAIIPCRPTHEDVEISLIREDMNQQIENLAEYNIVFEPKRGFIITQGMLIWHNGNFECMAKWENMTESLKFYLKFSTEIDEPLMPRIIAQTTFWPISDNQTLECKIDKHLLPQTDVKLLWDGPQGFRNALQREQASITLNQSQNEVVSTLKLHNITEDLNGTYECQAELISPNSPPKHSLAKSINITVIPRIFIKWDSSAFNPIVEVDLFDEAHWVIHAIVSFEPKVTWQTPDGRNITSNNSFAEPNISVSKSESRGYVEVMCQIQNVTLADMGHYTLNIRDGTNQTTLQSHINMTLLVRGPPQLQVPISRIYSDEHQSLRDVNAYIVGYPIDNITITATVKIETCDLRGCETNGSSLNSQLNNVTTFQGILTFPDLNLTQNQAITIEVCNYHGCQTDSFGLFYATDGKLLSLESEILDNDIFLKCNALRTAYSSITWMFPNSLSDRIESTKNLTKSHISRRIKIEQPGNYTCRGNLLNESMLLQSFLSDIPTEQNYNTDLFFTAPKVSLRVEDEKRPFVIGKNITLICNILEGHPIPILSWWKNNQQLKNSSDIILSKNQKRLRIVNAQMDRHEGSYACQAQNIRGESKDSIVVALKSKVYLKMTWILIISIFIPLFILLLVIFALLWRRHRRNKSKIPVGSKENDLEIPYENITFGGIIGSGNFGQVRKGTVSGFDRKNPKKTMDVAIKMMKPKTKKEDLDELKSELQILKEIGKHDHIVNFFGAHTGLLEKRQLYVIMEYCPFGNLLNILQINRWTFQQDNMSLNKSKPPYEGSGYDQGGPKSAQSIDSESRLPLLFKQNSPNFDPKIEDRFGIVYENDFRHLTKGDLCEWARHVAIGMDYLSNLGILHGDLACRNILIASDRKAKVSDFGMARNIQNTNSYMKLRTVAVPVRWMSPESLEHSIFTTASDVWSFGILLWELFSMGNRPYPGITNDNQLLKCIQNSRPSRPEYASDEIFALMNMCWSKNVKSRPSFCIIVGHLTKILSCNSTTDSISPRSGSSFNFDSTPSSPQVILPPLPKCVENSQYLNVLPTIDGEYLCPQTKAN